MIGLMYSVDLCLFQTNDPTAYLTLTRGGQCRCQIGSLPPGAAEQQKQHCGVSSCQRNGSNANMWNSPAGCFRAPREGKTLTAEKLVHRWI